MTKRIVNNILGYRESAFDVRCPECGSRTLSSTVQTTAGPGRYCKTCNAFFKYGSV